MRAIAVWAVSGSEFVRSRRVQSSMMRARASSTPVFASDENICTVPGTLLARNSLRNASSAFEAWPREILSALVISTWQGRSVSAQNSIIVRSKSFSSWRISTMSTMPRRLRRIFRYASISRRQWSRMASGTFA